MRPFIPPEEVDALNTEAEEVKMGLTLNSQMSMKIVTPLVVEVRFPNSAPLEYNAYNFFDSIGQWIPATPLDIATLREGVARWWRTNGRIGDTLVIDYTTGAAFVQNEDLDYMYQLPRMGNNMPDGLQALAQ